MTDLSQRIEAVREDVRECLSIIDELFPEDEEQRKPRPDMSVHRQYGGEGR